MIVWQRPNLLLLDEPTNHLDLATREALAMALNDFDGTVMLVSHDRHLLRAVCEDFWMVGRGVVGPFDGDLDDYQRYLLEESKRLREEAKHAEAQAQQAAATLAPATAVVAPVAAPVEIVAAPSAAPAPQGDQREQRKLAAAARQQLSEKTKPFKKELEQIDKKMPQLTAQRDALEAELAMPGRSGADIAEAGKQLSSINSELDALEERWLELTEEIDGLTQAAGLV
jgi:ATP-binding cassette subfamily F protein 3